MAFSLYCRDERWDGYLNLGTHGGGRYYSVRAASAHGGRELYGIGQAAGWVC
jgi:hypothetical protein